MREGYPLAATDNPDDAEHRRQIAEVANSLRDGKINATGEVTLTALSATTILADLRIGPFSTIVLSPKTANAAAAIGTTYFSSQGKQTATLTHANNAQTDRTFNYAVLG